MTAALHMTMETLHITAAEVLVGDQLPGCGRLIIRGQKCVCLPAKAVPDV